MGGDNAVLWLGHLAILTVLIGGAFLTWLSASAGAPVFLSERDVVLLIAVPLLFAYVPLSTVLTALSGRLWAGHGAALVLSPLLAVLFFTLSSAVESADRAREEERRLEISYAVLDVRGWGIDHAGGESFWLDLSSPQGGEITLLSVDALDADQQLARAYDGEFLDTVLGPGGAAVVRVPLEQRSEQSVQSLRVHLAIDGLGEHQSVMLYSGGGRDTWAYGTTIGLRDLPVPAL